ncbi:MAG: glycosyltransferase [Candidatus Kapaibacterium sp.]|nr:MAG: glycosyltransferase [Candidatus Kapabacteria bacterium]
MATESIVSIIIPTLNEAARVHTLAASLSLLAQAECIFVDGGSTDGTQALLQACSEHFSNCRWLQAERGRAKQMNAGAASAQGSWLLFLHADTDLPPSSYETFLHEARIIPAQTTIHHQLTSGAFTFRIAHERSRYRYLEWYVQQRCRFLKLPFGDQAIFVRKELFQHEGGFREDFPLMEDMEFVQRVNKDAGFRVIDAPVFTSARRYEQEGYWKRATGNILLQLLYRAGVHPKRLAAWYYKH